VKDRGAFVNFLRLAARESGQMVNFAAISREVGLSQPTVKSYYQLLEDMFIGFQVTAYSKSPRKNLLSTPRFFFFDLGIRHAASGVTPELNLVRADPGKYFEQWVGIEIWKRLQYRGEGQLHYLRTKDGAEVDFIVKEGVRVAQRIQVWYADAADSALPARETLAFEQAGRDRETVERLILTNDLEQTMKVAGREVRCVPLVMYLLDLRS